MKTPGILRGLVHLREFWGENVADTIAAVSTPPGRGGIAVVRISGPQAVSVAAGLVSLRSGRGLKDVPSWSVSLGHVLNADGTFLDEALVVVMQAPRSYTGEDVVEIQCHGGQLVSQKVLAGAMSLGARLSSPGEFTRRAYLSGRISLEQAEAVADVISAGSEKALVQAGRRLKGELGSLVSSWETRLVDILAEVQGASDFPEDIPMDHPVKDQVARVYEDLAAFVGQAPLGLALNQGIDVCLVGRPNAGKSSLFNALVRQDRAIVTDIPGTTRDVLMQRTEWDGVPVTLLDTAGLRQTSEVVEAIGVGRAEKAASSSEVIVYVVDDADGILAEDEHWLGKWQDRRLVLAINKVDLGQGRGLSDVLRGYPQKAFVKVSCVTGQGLVDLREQVVRWFQSPGMVDMVMPGSARQVDCIKRASRWLQQALNELEAGWTEDVVCFSLENALKALNKLTGTDAAEATLDRVFSRFCVGK